MTLPDCDCMVRLSLSWSKTSFCCGNYDNSTPLESVQTILSALWNHKTILLCVCSAVQSHPLPTRRQSFEDLSGWRNRFLRPVPAFSLIIPHSIVFGHPSLFFDQMPSVSDKNLPRLLFSWFFLVARKLTCSMNIVHGHDHHYQPIDTYRLVFASTLPTGSISLKIINTI